MLGVPEALEPVVPDDDSAGAAAGVAAAGVMVMVVGPFVVSGEHVDERAAGDCRRRSRAAVLARRLGALDFFRSSPGTGAGAARIAGKAAFAGAVFRLAEGADVEPQQ